MAIRGLPSTVSRTRGHTEALLPVIGAASGWLVGECDEITERRIGSRADQATDRRRSFLDLRVRVALARRLHDAVPQVIFQQPDGDRLQRLGGGGNLCQYVDAVGVIIDHPL
jgi:hypothetical protein